jgi:hypothetical protein
MSKRGKRGYERIIANEWRNQKTIPREFAEFASTNEAGEWWTAFARGVESGLTFWLIFKEITASSCSRKLRILRRRERAGGVDESVVCCRSLVFFPKEEP